MGKIWCKVLRKTESEWSEHDYASPEDIETRGHGFKELKESWLESKMATFDFAKIFPHRHHRANALVERLLGAWEPESCIISTGQQIGRRY